MSQKQEGKSGDDSTKLVGNAWEGFKKMWIECGNY